jgi:glycosyltransferase involved in cell wall biosynthesis
MSKQLSIIIPAFNREHLISVTLDSVIAQTFKDWECIVVDDSSTDRTQEVVRSYALKDDRIRLVVNHFSKGAPGARNTGIDHATGEFICFFDSDDLMYPNHVEEKIQLAQHSNPNNIITSFSHLLNGDGEVTGEFSYVASGNIFRDLLDEKVYVDTNSALMRRALLADQIRWDVHCPSFQEWDFHLQLAKSATYSCVPLFLSGYFQRTSGTISSDPVKTVSGRWFILLKYRHDFIQELGLEVYKKKFFSLLRESKKIDFNPSQFFTISKDDEGLIESFELYSKKNFKESTISKVKRHLKQFFPKW